MNATSRETASRPRRRGSCGSSAPDAASATGNSPYEQRSRHRFHRYRVSDLCLYFSGDPPSLRWTLKQRLTGLLDLTRLHLLKEAWWRVTNDWPSAEVHRDPDEQRRPTAKRGCGGARGRSRRLRHERRTCWCGNRRYTRCHGELDVTRERRALGLLSAP